MEMPLRVKWARIGQKIVNYDFGGTFDLYQSALKNSANQKIRHPSGSAARDIWREDALRAFARA
jgi:hypothetical protein